LVAGGKKKRMEGRKKEGPVVCHPFLRCGKFSVFD
jgi:hypothetical protein